MTDTIVRTDDLWKRYRSHDALRGLNLRVPEGGAYALIGANGAGKTTTIKLLMNILSPSAGVASVMGTDSRHMTPEMLAQIGYVSENQAFPRRVSVAEYFDYLRPFYPTWDTALEGSLRARLQLPPERRIGELSHGMRLKAALACALVFRPRLLILDEPLSGLDPLVREELMEGLLPQAGEFTMLIASQELAEIESITTHVGLLHEGRMLLEESMGDLSCRLREVRVTLDHPAQIPANLPREWLQARAFGNVLSFVDTRFNEAGVGDRVRSVLNGVRQIDPQPMPLSSVFKALVRSVREGVVP
jgi:ABC-2 type transport system ATP-binding protein